MNVSSDARSRPFALLAQALALAGGQIWANKVRSVLTTVGIVIGVAAACTVIAALGGLRQTVLDQFEAFGTNKIFVFPQVTERMRRTGSFADVGFPDELFDDLLAAAPAVGAYTRISELGLDVSHEGIESQVEVSGIDPDWHAVQRRGITLGRAFSFVDAEAGTPVALVNQDAVDTFRLDRDPVGNVLSIGSRRFRVIGTVEESDDVGVFGGGPGGPAQGVEVLIPFAAMRRLAPHDDYYTVAASKTTRLAPEAASQLRYVMRERRGIGFADEEDFGVEYVAKFVEQFDRLALGITGAAIAIVGISLVVGGVGIMNIMLVSVSERTREIGLRKAVGARPSAILAQFLVEAVLLCLIGGALGWLAGEALTGLIRSVAASFDYEVDGLVVPSWAILLSFGFSAAVGVVFGMWPAWKASRLDPIDALRHE